MPYKIEATCPNCKRRANGISGIEEHFGWRIVGGKKIPQSHCRACRANKKLNKGCCL